MITLNRAMTSYKKAILMSMVILMTICISMTASALPRTLEIFSDSRTSGATTGPTSSAQTHTFRLNANNPTDNNYTSYTPTTTVTYNISSIYNYSKYAWWDSSNNPDFTMGGSINNSDDFITSRETFAPLNTIGDPINQNFSASIQNAPTGCAGNTNDCSSGTTGGINTSSNYGMALFTSTSGLAANNRSRGGRHLVGTITATFNRAVTNPVLHLAGLGGTVGSLGFSAEFDLVNSASATGVSMSRLSGSSGFSVTSTRIANSNSDISATTGSGGASGSVYLQGRRITSLTFDVYVRGDGNGTSWRPSSNRVAGDLFFFGISSLEADNDVSIVKSQRKGTSDSFVRTALNDVPVGTVMQYQLSVANGSTNPIGAVDPATFSDIIPSNITNLSVVGTPSTTGTGTSCSGSLSGNTYSGVFSGPVGGTCTVTFQGTATTLGGFTNTANLFESSTDPDTTNNTSSVNATIINGAKIKIAKRSVGGVGTFNFSSISNLQNTTTDVTSTSLTTTVAGTAVTSAQLWAKSLNTAVNITEGSVPNYQLTSAVCTDANSATTGNTGNFGTLVNNTLTIAAANIKNGADITCTFTNEKKRNLTIRKSWSNAKINDAVNITATGLTDFSAIAGTASEIDSAGAKLATVGTQITIAESFTTGSSANYNASLQCMTERTTPTVVTVTNNQITMPDENVTCTYTNSRIAQQLNLKKQWQNATLNHSASVTTTGATNNPTFNSTATSAGNNATTGTAVTVYAGDVVTLPAETFAGGAIASNYTATVACAGGSMLASGATGRTLTISNNTTATECTYTNTNNLKLTDLSITKTDNVDSVYNDTDTTYTIVVTNAGPNAADGAIFKDPVATGLTKSTIACSATGGAVCPTTANLTIANIESSNGLAIPTLPNGGVVTFTVKANVTATSGNVSNVATITAPSGTTDPVSTNNSATDTDSVLTPIVIQGKVFEDNSGTTGIASNAYNAVQNTGEVGIANSTVQLTNCSGTVLATTETDAMGQYQFAVRQATLPSPNFCVVQTNVEGYTSVSGTTGYTRSTDTITVATSGSTYTNLNFGDAKLNLVLTESGQHTVVAGAVTDYPHRLQSDASVQVTGITQTLRQQPSSDSNQDWQALVYRDTNCNGTVDAGENLFNPSTSAPVSLLPSADICLVQRVHVPTNIYAGAQHNAQLEASYNVTLSNPAQTISGASNTRQDTTLVGSAGLELTKKVRKVASCPSTAADTAVFSTVNEATTLDKLEYEITYKNNSVKNLQNVKVKDSVPTGTTFGSISCQSTPSGNSCNATRTGEALLWQLTGNLTPASSGTVRFCVTPQ